MTPQKRLAREQDYDWKRSQAGNTRSEKRREGNREVRNSSVREETVRFRNSPVHVVLATVSGENDEVLFIPSTGISSVDHFWKDQNEKDQSYSVLDDQSNSFTTWGDFIGGMEHAVVAAPGPAACALVT